MGRGQRTHGIDAKRVGASKDSGNIGVQLQQPVVSDNAVTVTENRAQRLTVRCEGISGERCSHLKHHCATRHLLPKHHFRVLCRSVAGAVHGGHIPPRAEKVDGLGKAVVVDEARVHGEQPHQQEDVPAVEEHPHDLGKAKHAEHSRAAGMRSCDVGYWARLHHPPRRL